MIFFVLMTIAIVTHFHNLELWYPCLSFFVENTCYGHLCFSMMFVISAGERDSFETVWRPACKSVFEG